MNPHNKTIKILFFFCLIHEVPPLPSHISLHIVVAISTVYTAFCWANYWFYFSSSSAIPCFLTLSNKIYPENSNPLLTFSTRFSLQIQCSCIAFRNSNKCIANLCSSADNLNIITNFLCRIFQRIIRPITKCRYNSNFRNRYFISICIRIGYAFLVNTLYFCFRLYFYISILKISYQASLNNPGIKRYPLPCSLIA